MLFVAPLAAQVDSLRDTARVTPEAAALVVPPQRPLLAVGEVMLINLAVNMFDGYVLNEPWAKGVTPDSWYDNLRLGWVWDENNFVTNMWAHPYHGGLYYNAGRSNGLDFWESSTLAFLGSWTWEYFGEINRPSLNDFFMTSFGGIALGETFHRIGASIRNNEARGSARTWREIAALPLDPMGGINRLFRGEWRERKPNPPEHNPEAFILRVGGGVRFAAENDSGDVATLGSVVIDLVYGDPFRPYRSPFDVFGMRAIVSEGGGLSIVRVAGRLYALDLNDPTKTTRHLFAVNQRFDYIDNPAFGIGGQSVEAGVTSRFPIGKGYGVRTGVFGDGILLAAIDGPVSGIGERTYDFGPGVGARVELGLERHGLRFLTLHGRTEYMHSISGASADHIIGFTALEANVPVIANVGLALQANTYHRLSRYAGMTDDLRDYPELRVLLTWTMANFLSTHEP